jgi:hypothetical protein
VKKPAVKSTYKNASGADFALLFMSPRKAGFGDHWKYTYKVFDAQHTARIYRVMIARAHIPKEEDALIFAQGKQVMGLLHQLLDEPETGHQHLPDMSNGWAVYRS